MFAVRQFESKNLTWWYTRRNAIDMNPHYQRRGGIWNAKDKAFLIDSILNEYDIPKLYLADFTYGDSPLNIGGRQFAVIDGKQRLEAIIGFFDGDVVLDKDFILDIEPSLELGGLGYVDLKRNYSQIAEIFDNFNLSVMMVVTDEEPKINELFVRLNKSRPLTGAEVRNAMAGVVPSLIRNVASHCFFTTTIRFATNRGQDRNVAAKLLLLEFRGGFVDVKKSDLDRFVREGQLSEANDGEFQRAGERVDEILDIMSELFLPRDPLLRSVGPIPVYYWLVRETNRQQLSKFREFLVMFERSRAQNRLSARTPGGSIDPELVRYDNLDRSTNDAGSLQGRFEILARRYESFASDPQRFPDVLPAYKPR